MVVDMHTRAGLPCRTGEVNRAMLGMMQPAGGAVAAVFAFQQIGMIGRNMQTGRLGKIRAADLAAVRAVDRRDISDRGGSDLAAGVESTRSPAFTRRPEIIAAFRNSGLSQLEVAKVRSDNWLGLFRAGRA